MTEKKALATTIRIPDKETLDKLSVIAEKNSRSRNREIEYIIVQYVKDYEEKNGSIEL